MVFGCLLFLAVVVVFSLFPTSGERGECPTLRSTHRFFGRRGARRRVLDAGRVATSSVDRGSYDLAARCRVAFVFAGCVSACSHGALAAKSLHVLGQCMAFAERCCCSAASFPRRHKRVVELAARSDRMS